MIIFHLITPRMIEVVFNWVMKKFVERLQK